MEVEIQPRRHTALKVNSPYLSTDRKETCTIVGHTWRMRGMNFKENSSNRSRETAGVLLFNISALNY